MNLGIITTAPCQNTSPPVDERCSDPEFARENPGLCPGGPGLLIKPAFALTCALGSVQFRAYQVTEGVEVDVTGQAVFISSDPNTAVIGATSGNASGLAIGEVTINATFQGMTAQATLDILDCGDGGLGAGCQQITVSLMVLLDITKSMSLGFNGTYPTRLDYAKAAAKEFISEIDGSKDSIGLMTFTDVQRTLLSAPTGDVTSVANMVDGITGTQDKTSFFQAVTAAVAALDSVSADRKVLLIISDGEDTTESDTTTNSPFNVLADFKAVGGIVMCLGVRASDTSGGFFNLAQFATGGFFVNAYPATADAALQYISGLKGYVCAGNCTPAGDVIVNEGALNYNGFINWDVVGGNVDLLGNGMLDLLPGNGLYVDLGGSAAPYNGVLTCKTAFNLIGGHSYRISLWLAGNQQADPNDLVCEVDLTGTGDVSLFSRAVSVASSTQGFVLYQFNFDVPADTVGTLTIHQQLAEGFGSVSDPRWGLLLDRVVLSDRTDLTTLLDDDFDDENPVYVPPSCGIGTTYAYLSSLGHYGYAVGYNCYGGYGCLASPPGIQLPDPNPLSDIESGSAPPPLHFTSTKTQCTPCPDGAVNVTTNLIPAMTGYTTPSGVAAASSEFDTMDHSLGLAWQAFLASPPPAGSVAGWLTLQGTVDGWLSYKFPTVQIVEAYVITALGSYTAGSIEQDAPRNWTFEGSNDGTTWTVLDTRTLQVFRPLDRRPFSFVNTTAYLYYRLNITVNNGDTNVVGVRRLEMYATAAESCATATQTSTISQADADSKANAAALASAQAALQCTTVYTSTMDYTLKCATGCGSDVTATATASSFNSQHMAGEDAADSARLAAEASQDCNECNSNWTMTVADPSGPGKIGVASKYPSCACVTTAPGLITKVTLTFINLYHSFPSDLHFILVAPDGTAAYVMGNCGSSISVGTYLGGGLIVGPTITLDDDAPTPLPTLIGDGPLVNGTFQPTLLGPEVLFPPPAPQGPGLPTDLATFIGKEPNGIWTLWAIDAREANTGGIAGGWDLTITSA